MRELGALVVTFFSGAIYEAGCVFWVHHAEAGDPMQAAAFSGLNAVVTVIGVESFLQSRTRKLAYVLGFICGTLGAVLWSHG